MNKIIYNSILARYAELTADVSKKVLKAFPIIRAHYLALSVDYIRYKLEQAQSRKFMNECLAILALTENKILNNGVEIG